MASAATVETSSTRTMPAAVVNTCPGWTSCRRHRRNASVTEPSATPCATFSGSSTTRPLDQPLHGVLGLLEPDAGVHAVDLDRVDELAAALQRAHLVHPRPARDVVAV